MERKKDWLQTFKTKKKFNKVIKNLFLILKQIGFEKSLNSFSLNQIKRIFFFSDYFEA